MIPEESLLEQVKRYEEAALVEVYDRYSPEIYRYASRLLGDRELAEDCVSDTFSRFLTALKHGNGPQQHLRAYLYRVAHNWITDHYRRNQFVTTELEPELHAEAGNDMLEQVAERVEQGNVRRALALLTPEQRQVIVLKFLEEWENEEIAQVLGKPVGAIKALQHRAINALRRLLNRESQE